MSDDPEKKRYPYADAMAVAEGLLVTMIPHVERIVIAGSLRRKKPMVGDIELLFIPKTHKVKAGLFDTDVVDVDDADAQIEYLLLSEVIAKRPNKIGAFTWGPSNKLAVHVARGIPVDFFSTTPEKWWNSLVCRTGGKENNLLITTTALRRGWSFEAYGAGYHRTRDELERHDTTSERDVYEFIGLRYLEPEQRK